MEPGQPGAIWTLSGGGARLVGLTQLLPLKWKLGFFPQKTFHVHILFFSYPWVFFMASLTESINRLYIIWG